MTRLRVLQGRVGSESDPRHLEPHGWNREWTPRERGGPSFSTETAHVDVVSARQGPRVFIGGSRTLSDLGPIDSRIRLLPAHAIVLTSRTTGASAAVRRVVQERGLEMEVWTARLDQFPTDEAAYFARDEEMIRSADLVIAFWDGRSSGTAHELDYAKRIGKATELVRMVGTGAAGSPSRRLVLPTQPDRFPGGDAA